MNQQDYLKSLKHELEQRQVPNVTDILLDYQEHFSHARGSGKTDEQIIEKLGLPHLIAKAYETESMITKAKGSGQELRLSFILSSIGRLIVLAPFNFLVLFIPGMITLGFLAGGWGATIGVAGAGFGALGILPGLITSAGTSWALVAAVFSSLGLFGLAALGAMFMYVVTKYIALSVLNYLRWNIKFILSN